jgi:transcriptional antiterminator NusG
MGELETVTEQNFENERAWYIVQSYSGFENAAKNNLERRIHSMNMEKYIFRVLVPEVKRIEKTKKGPKEVVEKLFPGYIFVEMIVTDESWFVVRNTPMVTGFLGSSGGGAKPVPLPAEEIRPILESMGITQQIEVDFQVGDYVKILMGTFAGQEVKVEAMDYDKQIVTVSIDIFGRSTPQELRFDEVKKVGL